MTVGDRVRVAIRDRATWHRATADALDGAAGTVEKVSTHEGTGHVRRVPYVLVKLDRPVRERRRTITAHHFDADDLRSIP